MVYSVFIRIYMIISDQSWHYAQVLKMYHLKKKTWVENSRF